MGDGPLGSELVIRGSFLAGLDRTWWSVELPGVRLHRRPATYSAFDWRTQPPSPSWVTGTTHGFPPPQCAKEARWLSVPAALNVISPSGRIALSSAMSFMLVAPSTIATAMNTSATPRSTSGNLLSRGSADPRAAVSPAWSASLRSSTAPSVPGQALALAGHRQPVIPPRIVHDEKRSCLGNEWCGNR